MKFHDGGHAIGKKNKWFFQGQRVDMLQERDYESTDCFDLEDCTEKKNPRRERTIWILIHKAISTMI